MRWPRFAVLVLITALLQASFIDTIGVTSSRITPDLLLILTVFFATRCEITEAIISSFAIGLAADLSVMGFRMGPWILSFGLFGTGLAYLHGVISLKKMPHQAVAIFIMGVGAGILSGFLAGRPEGLKFIIGSAAYSAVIGPFLSLLLDLLMPIKKSQRGRR
jgi:cell shape-determining protein MreD